MTQTSLAAVNAPEQCVASGPPDVDRGAGASARRQDVPFRRLPTDRAFHSPMMEPAVAPAAATTVERPRPRRTYASPWSAR